MKLARPLLLITSPVGVIAGLREARRFHWRLAALMAALLAVRGVLFAYTWRTIRRESG